VAERDIATRLRRRASKVNIFLPDSQAARLAAYLELLFRWNRKINLTALTNLDDAIDRLLLEPLLASRYLPAAGGRLVDIGSGGGSPAIPLALAQPTYAVTMVESKARKAAFLREAIRVLALELASVECTRFQTLLTSPTHSGAYGAFSVRAVRIERPTLIELSGFLSAGGVGLVFRGSSGPDQLREAGPLAWAGTYPLLPSSSSRLSVFRLNS
jgi:16S rRNA (guanine527-N7)-methyltransferase